jgi:hypothetical protein
MRFVFQDTSWWLLWVIWAPLLTAGTMLPMSSRTGGGQFSTTARLLHLLTCPRIWATSISFRGLAARHTTGKMWLDWSHTPWKDWQTVEWCHANSKLIVSLHSTMFIRTDQLGYYLVPWYNIEWHLQSRVLATIVIFFLVSSCGLWQVIVCLSWYTANQLNANVNLIIRL